MASKSLKQAVKRSAFGPISKAVIKPVEPPFDRAFRLWGEGKLDEAIEQCDQIIQSNDSKSRIYEDASLLKGISYFRAGQLEKAIRMFQEVIRFAPHNADAYNNLGNALIELGMHDDAIISLRCAVERDPKMAEAWNNLGIAYNSVGRITEGVGAFQKTLELKPNMVIGHISLAKLLMEAGDIQEAIEVNRKALELDPDRLIAWSNLLMILQYSEMHSEEVLTRIAKAFGDILHPDPIGPPIESFEEPTRLKVGYVSGDLHDHPVACTLDGLFENHDRSRVEIFAYSTRQRTDAVTEKLKSHCDHWRDISAMEDPEAARLIAADGIHVLVDLSGHTAYHRLSMFAHRPAPVQCTWLGYLATTGLKQMDFIVRDRYQLPIEEQCNYTERIQWVEGSGSFIPRPGYTDVAPLPALSRGHVTFACFNNLGKITSHAISLWCEILKQVPGSVLRIDRKGILDPGVTRYYLDQFLAYGIDRSQVNFTAAESHQAYMNTYNEVDIVLDTFPYNGATTTMEALWMGVPVVSRSWPRMVGHFAESILNPCGHGEWVSPDDAGYIERAVTLAGNLEKLGRIRAGLRNDVANSSLGAPADCARHIEDAFFAMWHTKRQEAAQPGIA